MLNDNVRSGFQHRDWLTFAIRTFYQTVVTFNIKRKQGSETRYFSIGTKPGSNCFDPDKLGTKISGIRCAKNFTFHTSAQKKVIPEKHDFSGPPKTRFSRIKRARHKKQLRQDIRAFCKISARSQQFTRNSFLKKIFKVFLEYI